MSLLTSLLELVVPIACAGCGDPGSSPCPACARQLLTATPQLVTHAGLAQPVVAALPYGGLGQSLVVAHKERGRLGLATPLGHSLARAASMALDISAAPLPQSHVVPAVILVPVPSRPSAVRSRGHDAVRRAAVVAARALALELGRPVVARRWLTHSRAVADQADLSASARSANLDHALLAKTASRQAGGPLVVVVDDVCTSGASVRESVRALRTGGHRVVAAAVITAVPAGRRTDQESPGVVLRGH